MNVIFHDWSLLSNNFLVIATVVSRGLAWALGEHTVTNSQWFSVVDTTVSTMSLRYMLARCKGKKSHSKSAHISQRSFLYVEIFFVFDETEQQSQKRRHREMKKQQIRGGKMRGDTTSGGWGDEGLSLTVKSVTAETSKCQTSLKNTHHRGKFPLKVN